MKTIKGTKRANHIPVAHEQYYEYKLEFVNTDNESWVMISPETSRNNKVFRNVHNW